MSIGAFEQISARAVTNARNLCDSAIDYEFMHPGPFGDKPGLNGYTYIGLHRKSLVYYVVIRGAVEDSDYIKYFYSSDLELAREVFRIVCRYGGFWYKTKYEEFFV